MKNTKELILVGGGGHCLSVIDVAEEAGFHILGILDTPDKIGASVLGYKIIGPDDLINVYIDKATFLVTVGQIKNADKRIKLHKMIIEAGGKLATLISPRAYLSRHAEIGPGTVLMHNSFVNSNARIGIGCIINTFSNIEHDAVIGNFCHISTGAIINGECHIDEGVFIGSNSVLVQGIKVASFSVIGAGSVVVNDIVNKGVYYGNPVK